jgi:hypothetical protein
VRPEHEHDRRHEAREAPGPRRRRVCPPLRGARGRRAGDRRAVPSARARRISYRRHTPGRIVALADRIDHLAACFRIGLRPTGSADPHALRRAAQGIVRIILEREVARPSAGVHHASRCGTCPRSIMNGRSPPRRPPPQIHEFLLARLEAELEARGVGYDLSRAVLTAQRARTCLTHSTGRSPCATVRSRDAEAFETVIMAAGTNREHLPRRRRPSRGSRPRSGGVDRRARGRAVPRHTRRPAPRSVRRWRARSPTIRGRVDGRAGHLRHDRHVLRRRSW